MSNVLGELDILPSHVLQNVFRGSDARIVGLFYLSAKKTTKNIFKHLTQIDAQFFFPASYAKHLRSITRMLEELIWAHVDSDENLSLEKVEVGFGLDGFIWQESMITSILYPLIALSHRLENLKVCRIYWGSPGSISDLLPKMCLALRGCPRLRELSIWEAKISRNLLQAIMGLQTKEMQTIALARSELCSSDFSYSEDAVNAIELFAKKFSHVERISLPGLRGYRLNFELLLGKISFPNLRSLDLPYWCNEHSVFLRAVKGLNETVPYEVCRSMTSRFFNLPNLRSFTIDSKDLVVEAFSKDNSCLPIMWISSFCFNQSPVDHAWLVSETTIDEILAPLALLSNDMERDKRKGFLMALRSFCMSVLMNRCSVDYAPLFFKLFTQSFIKKLCSVERFYVYDDILTHILKDPFLATLLLPKGPKCLIEIIRAHSESHLELCRRQMLVSRILRSKELRGILQVDLSATDSLGNGIFHLAVESSLIIDAVNAGCNSISANKDGRLPIQALIVINSMQFDDDLVDLILSDTSKGPLGYLEDLVDSIALGGNENGDTDEEEEEERARVGAIAMRIATESLYILESERKSIVQRVMRLGLLRFLPDFVVPLTPQLSSSGEVPVDDQASALLDFGSVEFEVTIDQNAEPSSTQVSEGVAHQVEPSVCGPKRRKIVDFPMGLDAVGTIL